MRAFVPPQKAKGGRETDGNNQAGSRGSRHARRDTHDGPATAVGRPLQVGPPNDQAERQADRAAARAIGSPQAHGLTPTLSGGITVPPMVHRVLEEPGTTLDSSTRAFLQPRLGFDLAHVRVHADARAARTAEDLAANAYTVGNDIVFGADKFAPKTPAGQRLLAHELVHTAQKDAKRTLRRDPKDRGPTAKRKSFVIRIPRGITTTQQFIRYVEVQIFGRVINLNWTLTGRALEDPAKNVGTPIPVEVNTSTLEGFGVQTSADRKAAKEEAQETYKGLGGDEKDAINAEIDRRYYEATKEASGTKIKTGEEGKAVIWNSLMQQVLADKKKVEKLPDAVKALLGAHNLTPDNYATLAQLGETLSQLSEEELRAFFRLGPNGKAITPADYPQLLVIAHKLVSLSADARKDYLARVTSTTTSLRELETSISKYIAFRERREKDIQSHEKAANPLLGNDILYTMYRSYLAMKNNVALGDAVGGPDREGMGEEGQSMNEQRLRELEASLLIELKHKGFSSIAEFASTIEAYRVAFRTQAVNLALDVLSHYEGMLFRERQKLAHGDGFKIWQRIAATKAAEHFKEYNEQEDLAKTIWNAKEPKERWWIEPHRRAKQAAASAKAAGESAVLKAAGDSQIVTQREIDLERLATSTPAGVTSYLMSEISRRQADARETRKEFIEHPNRIFKLPDLVNATFTTLGITNESLYGRIVRDYIKDEVNKGLLSKIAITVLALALALIPGGGWLGAAALIGSAGLGTYQAYTAYKEYEEQQRDYELGFLSEKPSLVWVAIAIAGAALDLGVAASFLVRQSAAALKSLKKPLLDFAEDGNLTPLLAKIEAAQGLERKLKDALVREAKASLAARQAWKDFLALGGKMNAFAGLVDPGIAKEFFRALYHSIKRGITTISRLSTEAKYLDIVGDLTRMSGAERKELQAAFEQVKTLMNAGKARNMDESSLLNFIDRWAINRGKPGFQTKLLDEMSAWKPLTAEQQRAMHALEAQSSAVKTLQGQYERAKREWFDLRAKPNKNADDIAEMKQLEKELHEYNPAKFPDPRDRSGRPGAIVEAQRKLDELEKEAARAGLSFYDRLRSAQPSIAQKELAMKGKHVEDVGPPLKTKPADHKEVDHIVSVREIADMDGMAKLPFSDAKAIANMQENLIAMDALANASKGQRTWRSWKQSSNFYEEATITAMAKREAEVRGLIEKEIKRRLDVLATKP